MLGVWVPVGLEARSLGFDVTFLLSFGVFGCSSFFCFSFVLVSFLYTPCMLRGLYAFLMHFVYLSKKYTRKASKRMKKTK
jgi:hypothetical protein